MAMTHTCIPEAPPLGPELARLVDVGMLERAMVGDGARAGTFDELARAATRSGALTASQASAMAALLGLARTAPANDTTDAG
jgi:hypothetical protein